MSNFTPRLEEGRVIPALRWEDTHKYLGIHMGKEYQCSLPDTANSILRDAETVCSSLAHRMAKTRRCSYLSATTNHPPHGLRFGHIEVCGTVGSELQTTDTKTPEATPESHHELFPHSTMWWMIRDPICARTVLAIHDFYYKTAEVFNRSCCSWISKPST